MVNVIRLRYVLFAGSPGEPRCSQFVVRLEALLSLVVCAGVSSLRCCSLFFCPLSALVRESPVCSTVGVISYSYRSALFLPGFALFFLLYAATRGRS